MDTPPDSRSFDDSDAARVRRSWAPGDELGWGGTVTERYVVLERVGQGGMGVVLRAYDPKLRREVALKHVKVDRLDERAEGRLVREAQAMAKLSHPNVVAIYDIVEIESGGLVLAMEYVDGKTLRQWVEARRHEWPEVLAMFRQAGRGLAAAHDVGLIHRDFKPSNVLVGTDERARVTDFGLARLELEPIDSLDVPLPSRDGRSLSLDPETSQDPELTAPGQLLGTLPYMAPEQQRDQVADARADQFALCVSIWEALCGQRPFRGPSKSQYLAAKEAGPPAWPKGSPIPRTIVDAIRRGLAPDPEDRWPHVPALLRALEHDPGRRRRRVFMIGGMVTVAVTSVVGVELWQARRATQCSGAEARLEGVWDPAQKAALEQGLLGTGVAHAAQTSALVTARLDEYASQWVGMHTEACEATTVRGEQSGEALDLRMECLEDARTALGASVEVLGEADASVIDRAVRVVEELPSLSRCADLPALRAALPPPDDPAAQTAVDDLRRRLAQARSLVVAGRLAPGHERLEQILSEAEALGYDPLTVEVRLQLSDALRRLGSLAEAESALRDTLWDSLRLGHASVARPAAARLLYVVGSEQGRPEQVDVLAPLALALARGPNAPPTDEARALSNVGEARRAAGDIEGSEEAYLQALEIYERELGSRSLKAGTVRNNLGALYGASERFADAETQLRLALSARRAALGPEHPETALTLGNLAWALVLQDEPRQAEALFREALEVHESVFGRDHWRTSSMVDGLAFVMIEQERLEEAETLARRALQMASEAEDAPPTMEFAFRGRLGRILEKLGRGEEAEREFLLALHTAQERLPADHPLVAELEEELGTVLLRHGQPTEAEPHLRRALEIYEDKFPPNSPAPRTALASLAEVCGRDRLDESVALYERVLTLDAEHDTDPNLRALVRFDYARVLLGRDRGRAIALAREARLGAEPPLDAEIDRWLAERGEATDPARPSPR